MAAETLLRFVAGISTKLGALAFPYVHIMFCLKTEQKKLMLTLSAIRSVLMDAENRQEKSHTDEVWVEMLLDVLYDAEDLVDELSTEASRQQVEIQNDRVNKVLNFFSTIPFYVTVAFRMKSIRDRLNDVAEYKSKFLVIGTNEQKKTKGDSHFFVPRTEIIGREKDKKAVIKLLMDPSSQENVTVIPIVGIGGLGKTALAQLVYDDEKVKRHFDLRMWTSISDSFELDIIVKKILESIYKKEPGNLLLNTLQERLRKEIDGKRYLLVLDNVWNEDYEKWIKLKELLMGGSMGSKIIVTTRTEMVAWTIDAASSLYVLKGLPEDKSWSLFTQMAFEKSQEPRKQALKAVGMEIVKKCAGVPLAIRTIGSLLRFTNTESDWIRFKNDNIFQIAQKENGILSILKLNYDHLPSHLKRCFEYCSLFPKGYEIDRETLVNLWIAQGFVQPLDENYQCLEDIGHQYFMDLLLRSFFQEAKGDEWGSVANCKMHDLMHDLAKSVAGRGYLSNLEVEDIDERITHHISIDFNFGPAKAISISLPKVERIRTFLLPVQQPRLTEGVNESTSDAIFSSFRRLRVLDMHCLQMETLSSSIGEMKHLRYLDLSGNGNIEILPNSFTRLHNLQTLKLNNCLKLRELPRDMWKLVRLRHLEISKTKSLNHMPHGLGELISLRTLTRFAVGKNSSAFRNRSGLRRRTPGIMDRLFSTSQPCGGLGELNELNNLRGELMIKNLCNVVQNAASEANAANLGEKQYLQSLILQWGSREIIGQGTSNGDLELLGGLQPHPNLEKLSIFGYCGVNFPSWMHNLGSCLPNLAKITISNCKSQCLPPLSQLPSLKSLHLYNLPGLEYIDDKFAGSALTSLFFPALKEVKFFGLINLKGWWSREHQNMLQPFFPCLSKLHIQNCPNLTYIPLVPCIEQLDLRIVGAELLRLTGMKTAAAAAAAAAAVSVSSVAPLFPLHSGFKSLHNEEIEDLESLLEEQIQELTYFL